MNKLFFVIGISTLIALSGCGGEATIPEKEEIEQDLVDLEGQLRNEDLEGEIEVVIEGPGIPLPESTLEVTPAPPVMISNPIVTTEVSPTVTTTPAVTNTPEPTFVSTPVPTITPVSEPTPTFTPEQPITPTPTPIILPVNITVTDEVENSQTSMVYPGGDEDFPYTDTRDFYIFQDRWLALEVRLSEGSEEGEFNKGVYVHYFDAQEGGNVSAAISRLWSDAVYPDPATPLEVMALPESIVTITNSTYKFPAVNGHSYFTVEYFVDNYSDNRITLTSFNADALVPVRKSSTEKTLLSVSESTENIENYTNWNIGGPVIGFPYTTTRDFFIFPEEWAVVEVAIRNSSEGVEFDSDAAIHLFSPSQGGSLQSWVNNQYSDVVMMNPAALSETINLESDAVEITNAETIESDTYGNIFFGVDYKVEYFENHRILMESFESNATVPVPADEVPIGPCVEMYLDSVLTIDSASGFDTDVAFTEIYLSDFKVNGRAVGVEEVILDTSTNVSVEGDDVRCELPCSFGSEPGEWQFNAIAENYYSTSQRVDASYETFEGGCPSYNSDGTHVSIQIGEIGLAQ